MKSFEEPIEVVVRALDCIHRDQDRYDWKPSCFPEPWFVVWAVVHSFGIIENGGFRFFFENDWPDGVTYERFIDAYKAIGASESAQCLNEVLFYLFKGAEEIDIETRRDILDKHDNDSNSILSRFTRSFLIPSCRMDALLAKYIIDNESYFPRQNKR